MIGLVLATALLMDFIYFLYRFMGRMIALGNRHFPEAYIDWMFYLRVYDAEYHKCITFDTDLLRSMPAHERYTFIYNSIRVRWGNRVVMEDLHFLAPFDDLGELG